MFNLYDTEKAIAAQNQYCAEKGFPHFAPHTGRCYRCGRDIYSEIEHPTGRKTGITVERASHELITGCPHCNYSFCD